MSFPPASGARTRPPQEQHLAGVVVVVTSDRRSGELATALERRGAIIRHSPSLTMTAVEDDADLLDATKRVIANPPDIVVATTGVGFRGWIDAADAHGLAEDLVAVLSNARIVARGPKARGAIQAAGLNADWVAESETSAELAQFLLAEGVEGARIALQHHGSGADGLDEEFLAAGADVESLIVYRWGPPADPALLSRWAFKAADGEVDAIVFTSAPGVSAWLESFSGDADADDAEKSGGALDRIRQRCRDGSLVTVAVGPITAAPLRSVGIEPVVPKRGRLGALIRELIEHYAQRAAEGIETEAGRLFLRSSCAVIGDDVIELSPGALRVLRLLAGNPGGVVTREQILARLPGSPTTTHAADVAVARLRESFGDRAIVQTVVKRGYRLRIRTS
ncbi:uroporphyrinogen-III synthase [Pseudoclavibacter sp. RFBJ3]|uniref:uroporphyrinogen-III synthase n=1 Tax=unclassified Pseudoclavibacter TaxID=2615177 RepID=UPI000CE88FE8|nr:MULTISPECIES: uroporphyrinogen-III synthase [unclassified Pseudoclavibacter]PPF80428.1 uroporphyrinogen-III synthase [Pseudoclavibacter sp. RFBJ5]PPF90083.1 uroporphyrinogen-III synthase [Pseudoclavibacter sp. RFBJ3]PPG00461.1 uroporphyrinogen-III synthase [Pseudoclavibacter sp. RFBH5]PPG19167.1 uroporphyrinogen-III synthase [Pseudoclavibacter sp. RFBI4]